MAETEPCECELQEGLHSRKHPRSRVTLDKVSGPDSFASVAQRTAYRCRRCGATLEHLEEDRAPDAWQRTEACSCTLVRGTWDYGDYERPRSFETLVEVRKEEIDELTLRTHYRCTTCGARLEKTEEDHTATTWDRAL